jgi:hypothetical protein
MKFPVISAQFLHCYLMTQVSKSSNAVENLPRV